MASLTSMAFALSASHHAVSATEPLISARSAMARTSIYTCSIRLAGSRVPPVPLRIRPILFVLDARAQVAPFVN